MCVCVFVYQAAAKIQMHTCFEREREREMLIQMGGQTLVVCSSVVPHVRLSDIAFNMVMSTGLGNDIEARVHMSYDYYLWLYVMLHRASTHLLTQYCFACDVLHEWYTMCACAGPRAQRGCGSLDLPKALR